MKASKRREGGPGCLPLIYAKMRDIFLCLVFCAAFFVIFLNTMIRFMDYTELDFGIVNNNHLGHSRDYNETLIAFVPPKESSNYIIDTPGCRMLKFDPRPAAFEKYFKPHKKVDCNVPGKPDLTSSSRNTLFFYPERIQQYERTFNPSTLMHIKEMSSTFLNKSSESIPQFMKRIFTNCCYYSISRVTQSRSNYNYQCDRSWTFGKICNPITAYETTVKDFDAIVVNCTAEEVIFYTNVHHLVQKRVVERKRRLSSTGTSSIDESNRLNVLFFGTDSVSRLNFLRSNPKTFKYLTEELKAFDFRGYNKVGDNTFPNLVAALTGLKKEELRAHPCYVNSTGTNGTEKIFDDCPIIWKTFKKKGYITTFFEDCPRLGTFHYLQAGFVEQPTDHSCRPSFYVSDSLIGREVDNCCQGNHLSTEVMLNYSLDIMNTYANESTFSVFWAGALTHGVLNNVVYADIPHLRYLKTLKENGVLNRSVLFFLSDHGIRFGSFRETILGKVEESMPYLFIVVPDWFKERFKDATKNLERNSRSLVTPFDIHVTLKDIVSLKYENVEHVQGNPGIRRSISLFQEIPRERNCKDIDFPLKYCLCQEYSPLKNSRKVAGDVSSYIKDHLNEMLKPFPMCRQIEKVKTENILVGKVDKPWYVKVKERILSVQARYEPGNALIEVNIYWYKKDKKNPFHMSGDISRINRYGNQSHCVDNTNMKTFCICKDIKILEN